MEGHYKRRDFIRSAVFTGAGIGLLGTGNVLGIGRGQTSRRIGIIGLDTSHSVAFTKAFNAADADPELGGYKVVAAYPYGSRDIQSAVSRIPGFTEDVKKLGVNIVPSIEELVEQVDAVLLETNDGRLHLKQAMIVLKAGRPMFIDKPLSASLKDAMTIFDAAKQFNVPVFTSSSLRYAQSVQDVVKGKVGKVFGADTFSPATLEKNHPDLYWYGVHGIEMLFTVMGPGCVTVSRTSNENTDIVVGTWSDGRIGTFRGTRTGTHDYGGTVYGEKDNAILNSSGGYQPLLVQIAEFFKTGRPPVSPEETLEILAFMDAADQSKALKGAGVSLDSMMKKAKSK